MQKKKSEAKLNLPAVGIVKPTESSKNYTSKTALNKCREIDERNIYFDMPSIHQNDLSMKTFLQGEDRGIRKMQGRIMKFYESFREIKLAQEWELYMKKSEIANARSNEFVQIQEFLVRNALRLANRLNELQLNSAASLRSNYNFDGTECKDSFAANSFMESGRTAVLQDKTVAEKDDRTTKNLQSFSKSMLQDRCQLNTKIYDQSNLDFNGSLNQQYVLLSKTNELYEKRIEQLQSSLSNFLQNKNEHVVEKDVTGQLMEVMVAKNKYQYESQVKSMMLNSVAKQLTVARATVVSLKAKVDELQQKYKVCHEQNVAFKKDLKYRQLWRMSSEETITWRGMFEQERQQKEKSMGKIKLLKEKNKQLLNYFNVSNAVNPDQQEDKQDLQKIIKEFKEWLMIVSVPKVNGYQGHKGEENTQEYIQNNEVNTKLLRPNFYIFFQAFQSTLLMEKNIINIRPIEYNFFLKIRVILDTLYTSLLLARSYKEYSNFPEFVVGFLEKYQVNPETSRVQFRHKPVENEEKITFLVNLFNKNFCNTWECQIFKHFLYENYYLDEIFFFLDCRNELNSGVSSSNALGSADPVSFVKLGKALKLVTKKLMPYQNYIVQRVKNILKSKKKIKYGQAFIDKYFVLKILLEVYALEKAKSERIFQSSFKSKMKKSYITYGDFHHFMNRNFVFLSSVEIAELYREIYSLSSGHITYKAIHYICGTRGLFIPLLIDKRTARNALEESLGSDMLLLDIQNNVTKMGTHFEQTGIEHFVRAENSLNDFMRQLDWYRHNKSAFYQRLHQQKASILKINTLLQIRSSYELAPSESLQQAQIQTQMIHLHSMLHQVDTQVHHLSRQRDKRVKSMQILVRNFKIRIQQSMQQFEKVNEEEIKKLRETIQRNGPELKLKREEEKTNVKVIR